MARTLALFALAAALIATAWLPLERGGARPGDLGWMLALALVPTLAVAFRRGWKTVAATFAGTTLLAASAAFDLPLSDARPRDSEHDFAGPLLAAIRDGLRDFYETRMPFDGVAHWQMAGLVLLAVFAFVAATGALAAARRPVAAGLALLAGVAWPATLAAVWVEGTRPLARGALTLLVLLAFLFLLRDRGPLRGLAHAAGFAGVLALAALAASTSEAVAKPAFVSWQGWDFYDRPAPPVGVRYVWESDYTGISFPREKTVVLRVRVPETARSLYWRATTLDEYNGTKWRERLELADAAPAKEVDVARRDPLLPRAAREEKNWIRQDVTVEALRDKHLVGSAQPVKWEPGTGDAVRVAGNGAVLLAGSLERGQRYTAWSYVPKVAPEQLARVPGIYPEELDRYLEAVPGVHVPEFGAGNRAARMKQVFAENLYNFDLGAHRELYDQARRVVGEARTPYAAAVALEAWLRSEGGFVYDEQPPPFGSQRPLTFFTMISKRGYCQQFAGAMAVMLRLLGVPARVAAGFTSGDYDDDRREWKVTDHNAHTWVEVYFPGFGWLPFDPTPGRGALSAPYSAVSPEFDPRGAAGAFVGSEILDRINLESLRAQARGGLERREGASARAPNGGGGAVTDAGGNVLLPAFLVLSLGVLALLAAKALRRAARFARRDPRAVAGACRRDVVGFLSDQQLEIPANATLAELGEAVERAFAVDARAFVGSVTAARFAPPGEAEGSARRARRELRLLRRRLRAQLTLAGRVRGALSLRSLAA